MDLFIKLLPEDENDRLFVITLGIVLTFYSVITCFFILNRSSIDPFAPKAKLSRRITQLIINLPKPVRKRIGVKAKPKPKNLPSKEKLAENKTPKKIKKPPAVKKKPPKKIAPEKISTSVKKHPEENIAKEKPEIDLESLGMLSLVSVIDKTENSPEVPRIHGITTLKTNKITDFKEGVLFKVGEEPEIEEVTSVDEKARKLTENLEKEFNNPDGFEAMFSENDLLDIEQPENNEDYANDGTRNSEIIQEIVSKYTNGMKFCYNNSLRKEETLKGTVIVKFTILGSGMTDKVSIISNEIRDQRLEHCIIGIIFRWEFPPSKIDKLVVTYPISFVKTS